MSLRNSNFAFSSKLDKSLVSERSNFGGDPMFVSKSRSTFSHNQDQATSCEVLQFFGSNDRSDASMQDLYSENTTVWSPGSREIRNTNMSHSSCSLPELETFLTMASKQARTSENHLRSPKPITTALNENISGYVVGTCCALIVPWALPFISPSLLCWLLVSGTWSLLAVAASRGPPPMPIPLSTATVVFSLLTIFQLSSSV
mmetsp:Transcript_43045/g.98996  ORF Transcript_43045/g.98996 Transcript_43045/m.98996 type:complete len:202 (-) Transcript_43045:771-1376(-)